MDTVRVRADRGTKIKIPLACNKNLVPFISKVVPCDTFAGPSLDVGEHRK